jgi:quercetin dioxygenase-like cupin family protein
MKIMHESEIEKGVIEGSRGIVDTHDVVTDGIVAGVRVIHPNSDVPKRPHIHPERQLLYLISGSASITNGNETFELKPGDFAILEANEEHYVLTGTDQAKVFEVRYP